MEDETTENDAYRRLVEKFLSPQVNFLHEEFLESHKEEIEKSFIEPGNEQVICVSKEIKNNDPSVQEARRLMRDLSRRIDEKLLGDEE